MTLEQLNKHHVKTKYLDQAIKLAKEQQHLNISMLQRQFNLGYSEVVLLYEMVDLELQEHNNATADFDLSAEVA